MVGGREKKLILWSCYRESDIQRSESNRTFQTPGKQQQ
jgi:hypothetical protein